MLRAPFASRALRPTEISLQEAPLKELARPMLRSYSFVMSMRNDRNPLPLQAFMDSRNDATGKCEEEKQFS